jgi:hypothetical protein
VLKPGYEKLAVEQIKERIRDSEVVHFDETGMRVVRDLNWLHMSSMPELTAYHIDAQCGRPAMAAVGILPDFTDKENWRRPSIYWGNKSRGQGI